VAHQLLSKLMLSKDSLDLLLAKDLVQVEIRHAPAHAMNTGWPSRSCRSTEQRAAYEAIRAGFDSFTRSCWPASPAAARPKSICN
jgi:primosomal protein N' (replication factor Y)